MVLMSGCLQNWAILKSKKSELVAFGISLLCAYFDMGLSIFVLQGCAFGQGSELQS